MTHTVHTSGYSFSPPKAQSPLAARAGAHPSVRGSEEVRGSKDSNKSAANEGYAGQMKAIMDAREREMQVGKVNESRTPHIESCHVTNPTYALSHGTHIIESQTPWNWGTNSTYQWGVCRADEVRYGHSRARDAGGSSEGVTNSHMPCTLSHFTLHVSMHYGLCISMSHVTYSQYFVYVCI